jgi:hypothetical protein
MESGRHYLNICLERLRKTTKSLSECSNILDPRNETRIFKIERMISNHSHETFDQSRILVSTWNKYFLNAFFAISAIFVCFTFGYYVSNLFSHGIINCRNSTLQEETRFFHIKVYIMFELEIVNLTNNLN